MQRSIIRRDIIYNYTINYYCFRRFSFFVHIYFFVKCLWFLSQIEKLIAFHFTVQKCLDWMHDLEFLTFGRKICTVNVCATHLRCGRFRIRFLPRKIRADATNPGLLIRNEKMDGFLVSRYSTPKVTCSQCYEIAYFIYHLKPIIAQDIRTLYMKYKLHLRLQLYIS